MHHCLCIYVVVIVIVVFVILFGHACLCSSAQLIQEYFIASSEA